MSHIVTLNIQVKDAAAVRAACQRLNLPAPVQGKANLFSGEVGGLAIQLPDWVYPVVADLGAGQAQVRQLPRSVGRPEAPRPFPPGVCRGEGKYCPPWGVVYGSNSCR